MQNHKKQKNKNVKKGYQKNENNNKNVKQEKSKMCDFYYMAVDEVTAQNLFDVIKDMELFSQKAALWDAAQVIEVQTDEKHSIDIEKIDFFRDEQDQKFLEEHNVKHIYSIRIDESDENNMILIFKKIIEKLGGFVCPDTEDFMPVVVK